MPESTLLPVRWLPSLGINRWEDVTTLDPRICYSAVNLLCDQRTLKVRAGIAQSTFPISTPKPIVNLIYAAYSTGETSQMISVLRDAGRQKLWSSTGGNWSELELPEGLTITDNADQDSTGNLVQYLDNVYYTSIHCPPIYVTKYGTVHRAGCPEPERVRVLDFWESVGSSWTYSGTGAIAPTTERNSTMFVVGDGGVCIGGTSPNSAITFTWTPTTPFTLDEYGSDGSVISPEDYLCFYIHRFHLNAASEIKIRLSVDESNYAECPIAKLIEETDAGQPVLSATTDSIITKWSNNYGDFQNFFVKVRLSWFKKTGTIDWSTSAITSVSLYIQTTAHCSSANPAKYVVNYLHVRSAGVTPVTNGIWLADFEGDENWTSTGSIEKSYQYVTEGAWSLCITSGTSPTTATLSTEQTITYLYDGRTLAPKDRLVLDCVLSISSRLSGKVTIQVILTRDDGRTATFTYHPVGRLLDANAQLSGERVSYHRLSCPFAFASYGNGASTFNDFISGGCTITSIAVSITHVNSSSVVKLYCNGLRIVQGSYKKYIATFTPGLVDLTNTAVDKFTDVFLSNHPIAAAFLDRATDFLQNIKWKPEGQGYYQIPYYKHSEKGLAGFSSLLISAGGEGETSLWGSVAGIRSGVEGFRVTTQFRLLEHKDLSRYTDLWSSFEALKTYRTEGTGTLPSVVIPISDDDKFRIWAWIDDPNSLACIKFRLYFNADLSTGSDGWFTLNTDETSDSVSDYVEYVWDASRLHNKEAAQYLAQRELDEMKQENALRANAAKLGIDLSKIDISESPDYLKAFVNNTGATMTRAAKALGKVIPGADKLWQGLNSKTGAAWGIPSILMGGRNPDGSVTTVIRWSRKEFVPHLKTDSDIPWNACIGYSIEVVPKPGKTVKVALDNWYVHTVGHLSGKYNYTYTFTDDTGEESAPASISPSVEADDQNVYLKDLPSVWPTDARALNIYRMGGSVTTWNKVGQIGRQSGTTQRTYWLDTVPDDRVGTLMPEIFDPPPRAVVMGLSGERMLYANVVDRYNRRKRSRIYYSNPYYPGRCSVEAIRDLQPEDGDEITGHAYFAGRDIIFKNRSIWVLMAPDYIPQQRASRLGCIAKRSIAVTDGGVLFLSHDGPAFFDLYEASSNIGLAVRPILDDVSPMVLRNAIGFVHDNYYWLFYGAENANALVLHIPTRIWTQAVFKTGPTTTASVAGFARRQSDGQIWLGAVTSSAGQIYDFLTYGSGGATIPTDNGQEIISEFDTGRHELGCGELQKSLKAVYIRYAKLETSNASLTITPVSEQTDAGEGISTPLTTITITSETPKTQVLTPNIGNNGFTQGLHIIGSGRYVVSLLTAIYDRLPWRVR